MFGERCGRGGLAMLFSPLQAASGWRQCLPFGHEQPRPSPDGRLSVWARKNHRDGT